MLRFSEYGSQWHPLKLFQQGLVVSEFLPLGAKYFAHDLAIPPNKTLATELLFKASKRGRLSNAL